MRGGPSELDLLGALLAGLYSFLHPPLTQPSLHPPIHPHSLIKCMCTAMAENQALCMEPS